MMRTIHGAATMPTAAVTDSTISAAPSVARSNRRNSARECAAAYSVNTGITAVESAPSASRRRRMFGMRKATKKASVTGPAPKTRATSMSRANPSTRLVSVAAPMEPSAPTTWCSTVRGSVTLKSPTKYGMMHGVVHGRHARPREEPSGGEHEVLDQAHPSEREAAAPQSHDPLAGPLGGEDRALDR